LKTADSNNIDIVCEDLKSLVSNLKNENSSLYQKIKFYKEKTHDK